MISAPLGVRVYLACGTTDMRKGMDGLAGQEARQFNWDSVLFMVKPGSKDRAVSLLINGKELTALKRITWLMSDAFDLDRRIENYQGTRPIDLHRWDVECLLAVIDYALEDSEEYPDMTPSGYNALKQVCDRLLAEYRRLYGD